MLLGCTIFLGAFLLFLIEPLFAKSILPWFGGTAAVWTTCLVFFQAALLGGYLYAYGSTRFFSRRTQRVAHTALLACSLVFLPAIPGARWEPAAGAAPLGALLKILGAVIGLPFVLLATTGPLLQAWSGRESPYRLFALSNAAALIALLAYPVGIEPNISTHAQGIAWSIGFAVYVALCAALTWLSPGAKAAESSRIDGPALWTWFALAAAGSMLLLSTTNQLTQNIAAVPFLWVLPLIVYLVTFVLCFESPRWYRRDVFSRVLAFALATVAYAIYDIELSPAIFIAIPVLLFGLFAGCMFCHGELNARKPAQDHLTAFYLMIAAGGAAGALLVGIAAPAIFSGVYELAISMAVVSSLALWLSPGWTARLLWSAVTVTMIAVTGAQVHAYHRNARVVTRDFYGSLRVVESNGVRRLYHGTIEHGSQIDGSTAPTAYYGTASGVGLALMNCCAGAKRVGVIGLGAGTLATYGRAGDVFRFYEIDPEVVRLARSEFSFLSRTAAWVEIVIGDARLSLERESPQAFDVLVVDAFSGDAIPVHLLTREALEIYRRHLKPRGILAFHVSNQFLDLLPVVARLARNAVAIESARDEAKDLAAATWVLVTDRPEIAMAGKPVRASDGVPLWTDDYNNLFRVLRW